MSELDTLIQLLAQLPGLGPRSARRAALFLVKRREQADAAAGGRDARCGGGDPAVRGLRQSRHRRSLRDLPRPRRDPTPICVVEDLADLWALERTGAFRGRYHVLGGTLVGARRDRPGGTQHRAG